MEQHAVRAALSHLSYDSPLYLLLRELLPSTFPLSGYRSSFIIPDGVVAVGHMQTVHPALLTVTVRNRNGELHLHASPIKLLSLGGFDALPNERGKYDLLLERVASTVAPDNYSAVLPLIADGGNTKHDFSFTPVVGERYERTPAYGEMRNHVGLLTPRWKGSMERRQNKTDGDLRFLHRTDRGPLPQLVSGADMEALECQSELRVVIRSAQRPLQAVRPSVEPLAPPDPVAVSSAASSSSSSKKKRKVTASESTRKEGRSYGILHPRTEYTIHVLGAEGVRVEQAAILWAAPGSYNEQKLRQKRIKKYLLIDNCGEYTAADQSAGEADAYGGAGGSSGPDGKDEEFKEDASERKEHEGMRCECGGATGKEQSPSSGSSGSGGGGTQRGRGVKAEGEDDKPRTMDGSSQPSTAVTASPVQLKQEAHAQDDGKRDSDGDGDGERATETTATEEAPSVSVAATSSSDRPVSDAGVAAAATDAVAAVAVAASAVMPDPSTINTEEEEEQLPALERPSSPTRSLTAPLVTSPLPSSAASSDQAANARSPSSPPVPPCAADPPTPSPLDDQAASLESLIFVTRSSSSRWTVDQSLCDLCVVTNIGTFTIPFKLKLKLPNGPAGHHPLHHSEDAVQPLAVAYATIRTGAEDAGAHDSGGHNHRHGVRGIGSTVIFLTQPPAQQPFIDITPMDPASFHRIKLATSSLSVELSRGQQHVHLTARGAYLLRIHTTHPAVLIRQVYTTRDGQRTKNIISSPYNQGAGGGVPVFIDGDDAAPPSSSSHLSSSPILGSPQQGLYKTELCMSWTSSSMCRYGVKCKFAHGEHELVTGQRRRKYREKCIRFTQDGHCRHADRCLFMHEGEDATEGGLSRAGQGPPTAVSPSAEAARSSSDEKGEASEPAQPLVPLQRSLLDGDAARKDASASASAPAFAHVPSFRPSTIRGAESVSREVESLLSMLHPQRLPGTGLAASDAVSDEQRVGMLARRIEVRRLRLYQFMRWNPAYSLFGHLEFEELEGVTGGSSPFLCRCKYCPALTMVAIDVDNLDPRTNLRRHFRGKHLPPTHPRPASLSHSQRRRDFAERQQRLEEAERDLQALIQRYQEWERQLEEREQRMQRYSSTQPVVQPQQLVMIPRAFSSSSPGSMKRSLSGVDGPRSPSPQRLVDDISVSGLPHGGGLWPPPLHQSDSPVPVNFLFGDDGAYYEGAESVGEDDFESESDSDSDSDSDSETPSAGAGR